MKKECCLKPLVDYYQSERPVPWEKVFKRQAPLEVEIGFGMGEVLVRFSKEFPHKNFIGIERHWERIYKTLRRISSVNAGDNRDNIRLLKVDARAAFERLFAPKSIDRIFCLFPCPWPKKGHVKHRLFSNDFLKLLNNRLKKSGTVQIVTDFYPYWEWISEQSGGTGFGIERRTVEPKFETKFEKKWKKEGQKDFFEIQMLKNRHVRVAVKEDEELKSYKLKDFNPEKFRFTDVTGDIAVVFKDILYDTGEKTALIHFVVSEQHLTQHIRISVSRKNDFWSVSRAEGQNFFPSPGIAKALELTYRVCLGTV